MDITQNQRSNPAPANWVIWVLLVLFIALTILVGIVAFVGVRNLISSSSPLNPVNPVIVTNGTAVPGTPGTPLETAVLPAPIGPEPRPWDGASRVTILVMGLDYRDWAKGEGPSRTDTMILLTVDPLTKTAGILNIPRDLWVNIQGYGYYKINMAYYFGEGSRLPGEGGPGLAIKTVEQFLGVPINFYAQIDFAAFEKFIDEIGGVEIDVPDKIKIDPIGPSNTVILEPGLHKLDGSKALAYARARNTAGSDFDRADRQQKVILAIRKKILNLNMLPTLITKAPILYRELSAGVHTNMTLDQAISLAWLAQSIPDENLKRGAISVPDHVILAKSPDGSQDILKPISNKIRMLRDEIFSSGVFSPAAQGAQPLDLMKAEGARLSVLNGSGVPGIAGRTADYLKSQGADVTNTGDADKIYNQTTVIDYTGSPYTLKYLVEVMKIQPNNIFFKYTPDSQVDVVINVGADWAYNNPMP